MTDGTSQGLFIVVAIVIFGIFVVMAYILFEDTLSPALASMFTDATEQANERLNVKVLIADPNLEKAIRQQLISDGIIGINDPITEEAMSQLNRLYYQGNGKPESQRVKSVKGLEYATNITYIYLGNNRITDFKPISKLENITSLIIGGNPIENKHLKTLNGMASLELLNIGRTKVTNLSNLKDLPNLKRLAFDNNDITDLSPIYMLPNLNWVDVRGLEILNNSTVLEELRSNIDTVMIEGNISY